MTKEATQPGIVKVPHRKVASYGVHPVSGFLIGKGEGGQPWILHAYADVPEIESEDFKAGPDGKTMIGAGVHQRLTRIDIGAFLISEANLKLLSEFLKNEFKEKSDAPDKSK